jgi:hypothetical protein
MLVTASLLEGFRIDRTAPFWRRVHMVETHRTCEILFSIRPETALRRALFTFSFFSRQDRHATVTCARFARGCVS